MNTNLLKFTFAGVVALGGLSATITTAHAQTWVPLTNAPSQPWFNVASSADGTRLIASISGGGIYTSTNSGQTWVSNNVPARNWARLASSADGRVLVAVINILSTAGAGGIYMSTNGGDNWMLTSAPSSLHAWSTVACSTDGSKIVAGGSQALTRQIHVSSDYGATWTLTAAPNLSWYSLGSSADGTKLVALAWQNNVVYTSPDSGTTWVSNAIPNAYWFSVASSADGSKLVAAAQGVSGSGPLYTSTNSGSSWISNNLPIRNWLCVASSSDGNRLVASAVGAIYTTTDGGLNWTSNNVPGNYWASVASSADGSRLVAVAPTGQIYVTQPAQTAAPQLNFTPATSVLALRWPTNVTGFQLQQNSDLTTAAWTNVTNAVSTTNGEYQVMVAGTNSKAFYRLQSQ